ncbi:MAG: DNA recombination protein RmuC [Pseudomonadota bacterium]
MATEQTGLHDLAPSFAAALGGDADLFIGLAAGLLGGVILTWLLSVRPLSRRALAAETGRIEAERALAAAEVRGEQAARMGEEIARLGAALTNAHAESASLEGTLEAERRAHAAQLEDMALAEARMSDRFEALAARSLGSNAARFLDMVSERHALHATEERGAIEALVTPLSEGLARFEARLGEIERAREGAYHAINEQVAALAKGHDGLRGETARLVQALRAPKTRGRWGEMQLARVLELSGMAEHVDWIAEQAVDGADGKLRPDVVVQMPGRRTLVIDAKTPLDAYLDVVASTEPAARRLAEAAHARQLRAQVHALSAKAYWRLFDTAPDFVVMFVPGEGIYTAAMEADPTLLEDAFLRRVLIATPTTLIAVLRSVAHGWQQTRLDENAREIQSAALALYERLGTLGGHVDDLGRALGQAVERHNRVVGSFEGRVLPAARRFEALGIATSENAVSSPSAVHAAPRRLAAPEVPEDETMALNSEAPPDLGQSVR